MKKKFLIMAVCICLATLFITGTVSAGRFNYNFIHLDFEGIDSSNYYIAILEKQKGNDANLVQPEPQYPLQNEDYINAWEKFRDFKDDDGFIFKGKFDVNKSDNDFIGGEPIPQSFKVFIYIPSENKLVCSKELKEYARDSYYKVTMGDDQSLVAQNTYNYLRLLYEFLITVIVTSGIPIIIALLFGIRAKKVLSFVVIFTIVTQVILSAILSLSQYFNGENVWYYLWCLLELLIIEVEAIVFSKYFDKADNLKPIKKWIAPVYSIVANIASMLILSFILNTDIFQYISG